MNQSIRLMLAAAVAVAVVGCATQFTGVKTLRGADAAAPDLAPEAQKTYVGKRPGSGEPIARTFREQPPLIPHAIDNFDEITVAENQCLECHSLQRAAEKKAPRVGDSHLTGMGPSASLRMDRYQCNTCHVPQVDARPLVENRFVGTPVAPRKP
jgi:cytochrome c-type protein NapB